MNLILLFQNCVCYLYCRRVPYFRFISDHNSRQCGVQFSVHQNSVVSVLCVCVSLSGGAVGLSVTVMFPGHTHLLVHILVLQE